jgi:hypothetical protein
MTDRETITIPAPIARPGERVEVQHSGGLEQGTVRRRQYVLLDDTNANGRWEYSVEFRGMGWVSGCAEQHIRRVEGGS